MTDTNVGLGMVPCRPNCRCLECQIDRLEADNARLVEALRAIKNRLLPDPYDERELDYKDAARVVMKMAREALPND